jgi:hypothetical protein
MITKNDIQIGQELPFSIHTQLSFDNLCEIQAKNIYARAERENPYLFIGGMKVRQSSSKNTK